MVPPPLVLGVWRSAPYAGIGWSYLHIRIPFTTVHQIQDIATDDAPTNAHDDAHATLAVSTGSIMRTSNSCELMAALVDLKSVTFFF
jgi:hypothetical protein